MPDVNVIEQVLAPAAAAGEGWIVMAHRLMHALSTIVGLVGVVVLIWGVGVALFMLMTIEARRLRGGASQERQGALRTTLAFYLLLGLEFLVAADIIETIIAPSLEALAVLGAIVIIRTVISLSLNWEIRQESAIPAPKETHG